MSEVEMMRKGAFARYAQMTLAVLMTLAFACAVGAALVPQAAFAQDQDATLTLVVKHEEKGTVKSISGAEFTAYQVAQIGEGNKYELVSPFADANVDFNGTLTAAQSTAAAKSLASTAASKKPSGKKATTDSAGQAKFGVLDMGVYLVVQTGAKDVAQKYNTMEAFLVNVPQFNGADTVYDVVASPKPELKPENNPLPKTGDSVNWAFVAATALIGLLAMLVALLAARRLCQNV